MLVEFAQPEHGWLPIGISTGNTCFEGCVSDLPCFPNPIDLLIDALGKVFQGEKSQACFALEPGYYCFSFIPKPCNKIHFLILRDLQETQIEVFRTGKIVFEYFGGRDEILFAFYNEIKRFISCNYTEPHWPEFNPSSFLELKELIGSI